MKKEKKLYNSKVKIGEDKIKTSQNKNIYSKSDKGIYKIETKEYMSFNKKPSYIGDHTFFVRANSKNNAKKLFETKYKDGEMVKHYTGKKKVVYDLDNYKITRKKEYDNLF